LTELIAEFQCFSKLLHLQKESMEMNICIVEDEQSLAELIHMNLELEGYTVRLLTTGKEAMDLAPQMNQFNLVILDVMLPDFSGLEICEAIRKDSDVPILFLSAKGTTEDKIAGLKRGANDYLSKPFDLEELLLRVHNLTKLFQPETSTKSTLLTIAGKRIDFQTYEVRQLSDNVLIATLSKKEVELLRLFAEREGQVVSRDEILDSIWGTDQFPTSRTIDNYILAFRKLFETDPRNPAYFHSIRAVGYKFTRG
jgi:two-component system alkaline phosphatase synthesis response regulator PhoP